MTRNEILAYHEARLEGRLRARWLASEALGIRKSFYVYEPPGLAGLSEIPLIYLFRGHEREWVNRDEDASRQCSTAVEDVDRRITAGALPPMVIVMPGLNSANNHVPSLGIDMAGSWPESVRGLGMGRFWQYLVQELLPRIERDYPQTNGGVRLAAGFSLGGYTASLLAVLHPGYFDHVAIYDGLFMWPGHQDPRTTARGTYTDAIWGQAAIFDAALGKPRDPEAMHRWNPTDILCRATDDLLTAVRQTTFWISCAAADGNRGNRDRARYFVDLLRKRRIPLGNKTVVFHPDAAHTWHWADRFLLRILDRALVSEDPHVMP